MNRFKYITALAVWMKHARVDRKPNRAWRTAAVAATLGCAAVSAHAESWFQFEAGIGLNHYATQPDGTWWQEGAAHSIKRNSLAFSVGAAFNLYSAPSWGLRGHAAYVNLGHIGAECMCTAADVDYSTQLHRVKAQAQRVSANTMFSGSGSAQGISLTLEPYVLWRGWHLGVEGGVFPYRPDWTDTAYNPFPGQVVTYRASHHLQWGKVAGLRIERGNFGVAFQHYWLPSPYTDASAPAMATGANVVMVTYRF